MSERGRDGRDGRAGRDGADGQDGLDGKSAYDLALTAGFSGTLEDFITSLRGPQGERGGDGARGATGDKGEQGERGQQGIAGQDGAAGRDGQEGSRGQRGPRGVKGLAGQDGWSPILAVVEDGERRVLELTGWTGGTGTPPASGFFIGDEGLVREKRDASDVRGARGPAGASGGRIQVDSGGSAGDSLAVSFVAGETLGGNRAVWLVSGEAFYADASTGSVNAVLGITKAAASAGATAAVQIMGIMVETSWAWTPGLPVYLGAVGLLTQTPPANGAVIELGVALTATRLNIRIQEPIFLAA